MDTRAWRHGPVTHVFFRAGGAPVVEHRGTTGTSAAKDCVSEGRRKCLRQSRHFCQFA